MRGKSENAAWEIVPSNPAATFDVIVAGDMTRPGDRGFRVAQEVRHYAAQGLKVGLLQAKLPRPDGRIAQEVQSCVRRGLATIVHPDGALQTGLLIVHAPAEVGWTERSLAEIRSQRTVVVCHHAADFTVPRLRQRLKASAQIVFAPTNRLLREAAPRTLPLAECDCGETHNQRVAGPATAPPLLSGAEISDATTRVQQSPVWSRKRSQQHVGDRHIKRTYEMIVTGTRRAAPELRLRQKQPVYAS